MIIGIFGNLSSGKTLFMVKMAYDELQKDSSLNIISNFHLEFKHNFMNMDNLIQEIVNNASQFKDSLLLVDEVGNLIDARRSSSNLNLEFTSFITQIGKLSCNFMFTSQVFSSQVDLRVREMCDILVFCRSVNKNGVPIIRNKRIIKQKILIESQIFIKQFGGLTHQASSFFWNPAPYYNLYNTEEIVILDRKKYLSKHR